MKTERMEVQSALEQGMDLPYALIRSLSQVTLGLTPKAVDLEELIEARFFSETEEIRIFQSEDGLEAARLSMEADDIWLEESRQLMNPVFGSSITLSRKVSFDEDGQAYVAAVRLTGWKGGKT